MLRYPAFISAIMSQSLANLVTAIVLSTTAVSFTLQANELLQSIEADYQDRLEDFFIDFHANPELSTVEHRTAKKLAEALRATGFDVTEGVGGTGIVALLKNGSGPLVMMRGDIDALPIQEQSGLPYASKVKQKDPFSGKEVPVMHACGHDVHITSLIGIAKQMAERRDSWSGTLMLIGQPAEERIIGARLMIEDNLWQRFGQPDYAMAFHVAASLPAGLVNVQQGSPMAGSDSLDIIIHGVGTHGASPHAGKDPIVLGSQIVLALQTLVSRELAPRQPGVITVGAFHSGSKHNIISDRAVLQLTVRNTNLETRALLLDGVARIAENLGRAAGLPEDKLPEVIYTEESTPPTVNDDALVERLKALWQTQLGQQRVVSIGSQGMGAEDFPFFTTDPPIPSVYFAVGGTSMKDIQAAMEGTGPAIPSHHSPLFKIEPQPAITTGIHATVLALLDLLQSNPRALP